MELNGHEKKAPQAKLFVIHFTMVQFNNIKNKTIENCRDLS